MFVLRKYKLYKRQFRRKNVYDTYPIGNDTETGPENSPASTTFKLVPNIILHSARNEMVQNGRKKSW